MKIFLNEISEIDRRLDLGPEAPGNHTWACEAASQADEDEPRTSTKPRRFDGALHLQKVDGFTVAAGNFETEVHQLCSRCAKAIDTPIHSDFLVLFTQDPNHEEAPFSFDPTRLDPEVAAAWGRKAAEGEADLDVTYLQQDFIDLNALIAEQVMLKLPFQPLCADACLGLCQTCGANLNEGRCACRVLAKEADSGGAENTSPFAVLPKLVKNMNLRRE